MVEDALPQESLPTLPTLKETNTQCSGHIIWVKAEMYSKGLVRAFGISHKKELDYQLKSIKVMKNGLCL